MWCQGFSEPGAGSDCDPHPSGARGRRLRGQLYAEYCILLTRTDADAAKHGGITFLILDMKTPGVEVRPLRQANGMAKYAEIFLTDVRIPVENRVGDENNGWGLAQTTLASERGVLSFERNERLRYHMENFHADAVRKDAAWLGDDEYAASSCGSLWKCRAAGGSCGGCSG